MRVHWIGLWTMCIVFGEWRKYEIFDNAIDEYNVTIAAPPCMNAENGVHDQPSLIDDASTKCMTANGKCDETPKIDETAKNDTSHNEAKGNESMLVSKSPLLSLTKPMWIVWMRKFLLHFDMLIKLRYLRGSKFPFVHYHYHCHHYDYYYY